MLRGARGSLALPESSGRMTDSLRELRIATVLYPERVDLRTALRAIRKPNSSQHPE